LVGPLENGHIDGDSLHFNVMNFACRAFRQGEQMSVELSIAHGRSHELSLRFASPDTAALVQSPEALAGADRWAQHVTVVSAGSTAPQVLSAGTRYDIVRHAV